MTPAYPKEGTVRVILDERRIVFRTVGIQEDGYLIALTTGYPYSDLDVKVNASQFTTIKDMLENYLLWR